MKTLKINLKNDYSNLCDKIYKRGVIYSAHYFDYTVYCTKDKQFTFDLSKQLLIIEFIKNNKINTTHFNK